jgi:hypothetical protein
MVDPENIVLEHLRAIRADGSEVKQRITSLEHKLDSKAEAGQLSDLERKVDGLTHVVISSFGSLIHSLDSIDKRVSRLEREPA